MPTFIDESGDTGSPADSGNAFFHLAAVFVPTHDGVEKLRDAVRTVRRTCGLRTDYEFKFSKTWARDDLRESFFRETLNHPFTFAVSTFDKRFDDTARGVDILRATAVDLAATLRPSYLRTHEGRSGLSGNTGPLKELVIVDDNEDREFLDIVKKAFRGLGRACDPAIPLVGKVKFRDSGPEELIQVVDMICGAAAAFVEGKEEIWFRAIRSRNLGRNPPYA